jgi:hypothetical protein
MTTIKNTSLTTAEQIESACIAAHLARQRTMTLSIAAGQKRPAGFPRGEFLSVNAAGVKNYAVDPLKMLVWLRERWPA